MGKTTIEWCDHSINPIRARLRSNPSIVGHYCEKVSAGCKNCYASRLQQRFQMPEFGSGQKIDDVELFLDTSKLDEVRRRKKPTKYFWCDMTDIFGNWVQREWLRAIFKTIDETPQHVHMLLTKRPENILKMWPSADVFDPESEHKAYWPNVWIGTSIENQHSADLRIPELLKCRELSPVLFLSCEPLLGPVDLMEIEETTPTGKRWWSSMETGSPEGAKIDFVIVGGESGSDARPMNPDWVRMIRDQCLFAGVPFYLKQWGAWVPYEHRGSPPLIESQHGFSFDLHGLPEGIIDHEPVNGWYWPDGLSDVVYRSVGKKIAGRKLDGVTHDAFP